VTAAGFASPFLTKLRFENSPNKKTLKQAWRFSLFELCIRDRGRIQTFV
jgi:hypothetical protein